MAFLTRTMLVFIFGLLGNIISFFVFLAPLPTFYTIYKNKSSEGFQSIPYVVALMSAMLLRYYAFLKTNAYMIFSINAVGCAIELFYLTIYIIYASKKQKVFTMKLIVAMNVVAYGLMELLTLLLTKGRNRVSAVGWLCAAFNLAVFASPLSIMKRVIVTGSVEYMPFTLSFILTLCATMWFFYGFFIRDFYIALPNVVGFFLGVAQMALYAFYKYGRKDG